MPFLLALSIHDAMQAHLSQNCKPGWNLKEYQNNSMWHLQVKKAISLISVSFGFKWVSPYKKIQPLHLAAFWVLTKRQWRASKFWQGCVQHLHQGGDSKKNTLNLRALPRINHPLWSLVGATSRIDREKRRTVGSPCASVVKDVQTLSVVHKPSPRNVCPWCALRAR